MLRMEWLLLPGCPMDEVYDILTRIDVQGAVYLPLSRSVGFKRETYEANPFEQEHYMLVAYCAADKKQPLLAELALLDATQFVGATRLEA